MGFSLFFSIKDVLSFHVGIIYKHSTRVEIFATEQTSRITRLFLSFPPLSFVKRVNLDGIK